MDSDYSATSPIRHCDNTVADITVTKECTCLLSVCHIFNTIIVHSHALFCCRVFAEHCGFVYCCLLIKWSNHFQEVGFQLSGPSFSVHPYLIIMRPSSLGGGRILRHTLSVRLSVCILSVRLYVRPSRYCFCLFYFTVEPSYERTSKIEKTSASAYGPASPTYF